MLDIADIRTDPERIRAMLRNRNYSEDILNEFLSLDAEWRRLVEEGNQLRRKRNEASIKVPKMKGEEKATLLAEMKAVAQRIADIETRVAELEQRRSDVVLLFPNQPDESVPVGVGYDHNKLILESGKPREFDFPAKDHIELGESLDIIDFSRGVKISGSGFYVLKGDGARLERAMINYIANRAISRSSPLSW
jgi:seryl-tRNA synthetase